MTDNFLPDVKINQFQFNVGNQLMFVGIIVFEVGSSSQQRWGDSN